MCANEFNYQDYGMTSAQWNKLPEDLKTVCKNNKNGTATRTIAAMMNSGESVDSISQKLTGKKASTDTTSTIKGTGVEKTTEAGKLEDLKPKYKLEDINNKTLKEGIQHQWEEYFEAHYTQNPSEAREDIVKTLYRKEVKQVQAGLQQMLDNTKQNRIIKTKYLAEGFATEKEKEDYEKAKKALYDKYNGNHAKFQKECADKIEKLRKEAATPKSQELQAKLDTKQKEFDAKMKELETRNDGNYSDIQKLKDEFEKVKAEELKKIKETKDEAEKTRLQQELNKKYEEHKKALAPLEELRGEYLLETNRARKDFQKEKALAEKEITNALDPAKLAQIKDLQKRMTKNSDADAIAAYNSFFREAGKNDPIDEGGHITPQQLKQLVEMEALDAIKIDGDRLEDMAVKAIIEKKMNEGVKKANEYKEEIARIKKEELSPEAKRIMDEAVEKDLELNTRYTKLLAEAETEESKALSAKAKEDNVIMREEIATLKRKGKHREAAALEQKRLRAKKEAEAKISAAMDQDKLKEATNLLNEQKALRAETPKKAYEALDPKVKEKIAKLEAKMQDAIKSANSDSIKDLTKNKDEVAKLMAEAMVANQEAELVFKNTEVLWNENSKSQKPDAQNKNILNKEMREWIQNDPKTFECLEGTKDDYDFQGPDGKYYKFDGNNFQKVMLKLANDNQLDNMDVEDATNRADYNADIKERKEVTDLKAGHSTFSKFKDRNFARKCYKAAGIDYEKDLTGWKRAGHVAKSALKGGIAGGAAGILTEYLTTTKITDSKFFKLVQLSGSVPYSQLIHVKGETDAKLTGRYQNTVRAEGDVAYHQDILVEGEATGMVTLDYSGTQAYSGTVGYSGVANYSGTVGYEGVADYSGTVGYEGVADYSGKVGYEGVADYSGKVGYEGVADYSGKVGYEGVADYSGKVGYEGIADYSGKVGYEGVADYSGKVGYEGIADYSGSVDYSGTAGYSGSGTINGIASGNYSGTASTTIPVEHTHTDYSGGMIVGQETWTENVQVDIPYSGSLDIPYEQGYTYSGEVGYSGTAGYSGQVGYSGEVGYQGQVGYSGEVGYQGQVGYSGEVGYQGQVGYKGEVGYQGQVGYKGEVGYQGQVGYKGEVGYQGQVGYKGEVGYQGQVGYKGEVGYQGQVGYQGEVGYQGQVNYSGQTTGQASIPYKRVVSADGTVHFVKDIEIDDEVTLEGKVGYETTVEAKGEAKWDQGEEVKQAKEDIRHINWKNIADLAIKGVTTGAIGGLSTMNKVYDEGDRKMTIARRLVAEKGLYQSPEELKKQNTPPEPFVPEKTSLKVEATPVKDIKLPTVETKPTEKKETQTPATTPKTKDCNDDEDCTATAKEVEKGLVVEKFPVGAYNLADIIKKKYNIPGEYAPGSELYKAVGVVKEWHGITAAQRKKEHWISVLNLEEKLEIPGGKTYDYVKGVKASDIKRNDDLSGKVEKYHSYARVSFKAGVVSVKCDGKEYPYDTYDQAKKAAEFYNKNKRLPTAEELKGL